MTFATAARCGKVFKPFQVSDETDVEHERITLFNLLILQRTNTASLLA